MTGTPIRVGIIGAHPERGWAATAHFAAISPVVQPRSAYPGKVLSRSHERP
jgi:predicted dehydrogenase